MKKYFLSFVFILLGSWILSTPAHAAAASFYVSPATGTYRVGDTITASILIDSGDQAINAGEASATFSSDLLEYQSVSTSGSIFTFWTSGPTGGATSLSFGGGLSNPGYTGSSGKTVTVTWKAKATGTATVNVSGSRILANDGAGTNVYSGSRGASYTIDPAVTAATASPTTTKKASPSPKVKVPGALTISSTSHPDQAKWYTQKKVDLKWSGDGTQTGYSFTFDQSPTTNPPDGTISKETSHSYDNVADGTWYFHVKGKTAAGFGPVAHFKVSIDTTAPDEFSVTIDQKNGLSNPTPQVVFAVTDSLSGFDHAELTLDGDKVFNVTTGDTLPKKLPGDHKVTVKAFDKAGNSREASTSYHIVGIDGPTILDISRVVDILQPVKVTGRSKDGQTVHVYIDDKEVDSFEAAARQKSRDGDQITWNYEYTSLVMPGNHSFRFSHSDAAGGVSALTQALMVYVAPSFIKLGNTVIPTYAVVALLALLTVTLSGAVIILVGRLHQVVRTGLGGLNTAMVKRRFQKVEQNIDKEIISEIPDDSLSAGASKLIKKHLKEDVHKIISAEEKDID